MMQEKQKGRCIYCGGDVLYDSGQSLVRCDWCGQSLAVASFENELTRMKAALAEGEQAKKDLAAAEAAELEARQRLNQVLTAFDELSASQKREEETAAQIKAAFAEDAAVQSAMMDLLAAIRTEAGEGRDVLGDLLGALTRGQQDAGLRLTALQNLSREILKAQKDFGAQLSVQTEIYNRLQAAGADVKKSQELLQSLMVWFQTAGDDERARLEQIASSSTAILQNQKEAADQLSRLQAAADQTQKTIRDFESHYTKDRLEELRQLYHQAENFQLDRDYDKAADYYRQVITKGGQDAEVLWRLLLCHYCITYRKNDAGEPVPTILYPDLTDPEEMSVRRELASAMAGNENRRIYEAELARIDGILDEYRLASQEAAYDFDVFLSVRQEKDGHFTKDSDVASDLYDFLTSRGLRVFNSRRVVLPVGKSYEPYIISALLSAKVMIVVGSSADNMNSQWVKDEWSRFQWLQKREKKQHGKTDRRLLCYLTGGMRPEQIPRSLGTGRQAVVDGVKAHEQLTELLEEMPVPGKRNAVKRQIPAEDSFEKVAGQMTVWLYNGKYDKVRERYQELNESGKHLEQVKLHLFALCAENQIDDIGKLARLKKDLSQERLFQLAQKLSSGEEKEELQRILHENQAYRAQIIKETEEKKRPQKTGKPAVIAGETEESGKTDDPEKTTGTIGDPGKEPGEKPPKKPFWLIGVAAAVLVLLLVVSQLFGGSSSSGGAKSTAAKSETQAVTENAGETTNSAASSDQSSDSAASSYNLVNPGKLTVGYEPFVLPWESDSAGLGNPVGFDIDLAKTLAERMGLELELVSVAWDSMLVNLDAGKYDMAISAIMRTPEREEQYFLSNTYAVDQPMLLHTGNLVYEGEYAPTTALDGKTIAYVDGTEIELYKDEIDWPVKANIYEDKASALEALGSGEVDGICINSTTLYQYKEIGEEFGIDLEYLFMSNTSLEREYCAMLSKDNTELGNEVNKLLRELRNDGTMKELAELWFGTDYPVNKALENLGLF